MYIKCPNCQTAYKIKAHTLPPQGKKMRCAKCHHIWSALPPQTETKENTADTPVDVSAFHFAFDRPYRKKKKSTIDIFNMENILQTLLILLMLCASAYTFYHFL